MYRTCPKWKLSASPFHAGQGDALDKAALRKKEEDDNRRGDPIIPTNRLIENFQLSNQLDDLDSTGYKAVGKILISEE